jgi:hypothetical protein
MGAWQIGYCTNVHAGQTLEEIQHNLQECAVPVRHRLQQDQLGIGLWLPATAAVQMIAEKKAPEWREWLAEQGLQPYTINGFPYGNFHKKHVKKEVYRPTWWDAERLEYTMQLVTILDQLLPPGVSGSISTLPIAWNDPLPSDVEMAAAANALHTIAQQLSALEQQTGRWINVALEPEPGAYLDTCSDVLEFFERFVPARWRRYLTVCHDVCHTAVMYESQAETLRQYGEHGIVVGKLQASSAIEVRWSSLGDQREVAIDQLSVFAEDRYLHQTCRRDQAMQITFVEDLPQALDAPGAPGQDESWRIHFHVPLHLACFGQLFSTQPQIGEALAALQGASAPLFTGHIEAETYAWGVLPEQMQPSSLDAGLADELQWLQALVASQLESPES